MKAAIAIESYITTSHFILSYGSAVPPLYSDPSIDPNIVDNNNKVGKTVVSKKTQENTVSAKNNITKMLLEKGSYFSR